MRRIFAPLALLLALTGSASAADCWGNAAGTQADCGAVQMYLDVNSKAVPVTAAAPLPVTATLSATGANNADTVANVATGLNSDVSYNFVYNGTTWDRLRGDATNGAYVNIKAAITLPVTLPTTPLVASGSGVVLAPSAEAGAGVAPTANTTTGKGLVLKSGAGNLYSLVAKIGATSGYVILTDATAIATDGAVTYKWCKPVLSNGTLGGDDWRWSPPLAFSVGITVNFSTTGCATMTGSTTAEFSGQAK